MFLLHRYHIGAGSLRIGTRKRQDGVSKLEYTTDGITLGADRRLGENWTLGMGVGFAHDDSTLGNDDVESISIGRSLAVYASYQPSTSLFVDVLVGYGTLSMDTTRYVPAFDTHARANRAGSQRFGSIAAGYEYRDEQSLLSPYARFDYSDDRLDEVTETGAGSAALSYRSESSTAKQISLGLRAETTREAGFGLIQPRVRVEYQRHILSGDRTSVSYADLSAFRYELTLPSSNADALLLGLGSRFMLQNGLNLDLDYEFAHSSDQENSHALFVRFTKMFGN